MKHSRKAVLGLALLAILASLGCSSLPTAPVLTSDRSPVASGGTIVSKDGELVLPALTDSVDLQVSRTVNGTLGGSISVGCVTLQVPSGAYSGAADIRIAIPDSTRLQCKLDITAGKNGFDAPVLLRFNAAGHGDVRTLGIYWHNETSGEWELVESTGNPQTGMVEALLPHFSEYRVDTQFRTKAGW